MATMGAKQAEPSTAGPRGAAEDAAEGHGNKPLLRCLFCIANPEHYKEGSLCCSGVGFQNLALVLQHITKKHGHCFECNGMANITSIKTWAAKQSEHICEPADTTKTVPDGLTGRRRRTSAKEGRPEALLRTALEIWRKAGEMGLEKFKNSEEWHGVKRRVDAARTRHDDDEDREWVVWFAMLFARWDIIGNVNPRARFMVPAVTFDPNWHLHPSTQTDVQPERPAPPDGDTFMIGQGAQFGDEVGQEWLQNFGADFEALHTPNRQGSKRPADDVAWGAGGDSELMAVDSELMAVDSELMAGDSELMACMGNVKRGMQECEPADSGYHSVNSTLPEILPPHEGSPGFGSSSSPPWLFGMSRNFE